MTEGERTELKDIHDYLFKKDTSGSTRAEKLDKVIFAAKAGAWAGRGIMWLLGFVGAFATAFAALKGWISFGLKG